MLHIVLVLLMSPLMTFGQLSPDKAEHDFYKELALKDARHEQSLPQLSKEDEADFWRDQKNFEVQLQKANPAGYRVYLNTKGMAYRQHQLHGRKNYRHHSEEFERQAAFYIVNGQVEEMAYTIKRKSTVSKH